jgi:NADH-quinone oxidoreductase subunit L
MTLLLLTLIPLGTSVIQLLFGRRLPRQGDWLAVGGLVVSWILAMTLVAPVFFFGHAVPDQDVSFLWATSSDAAWRLGVHCDGLTLAMLLVVTTCSLLIHIFSTGYMHGNPLYSRFFAQISFFTFAMLGLVVSDNFLFLFICWELMGLCSYLLIGFYSWAPACGYDRDEPRKAAMKAFLTTRVGDVALLVGIAALYSATGELTFSGIAAAIERGGVSHAALLVAAFGILGGAIGKSAQFPLHVWLPDAMEGPSPVSALIHAATMVAAGIYLVGRAIAAGIFPQEAILATALVGSFTALFSATMALPAYDFKKILAYSTISQLGFMLTALAVDGWTAGFFHLTTHAFFKALLFLGSGVVLHAVHTRDMRKMGGLKSKLPITYWTMMIGSLSLSGFPFLFAGFWSKDEILGAALAWGMRHGDIFYIPFFLLIAAAGLTAFYTFRMMILVFHGEPAKAHGHHDGRHDDHAHHNHEPLSMIAPLIALAFLAIVAGWPFMLGDRFHEVVTMTPASAAAAAVAEHGEAADAPHSGPDAARPATAHGAAPSHGHGDAVAHRAHNIAMIASIIVALGGIGLAFAVYHYRRISPDRFTRGRALSGYHNLLVNLYGIDACYMQIVKEVVALTNGVGLFDRAVIDRAVDATAPGLRAASIAARETDARVIDYVINGAADVTRSGGGSLRKLQTGRVQDYALALMAAVLILVIWVSV